MTFYPFYSDISVLSSDLKNKLLNKNISISFSKGEGTEFDNIQTVVIKNGDRCSVVYVGYTVNDIHFMIQVTELYFKTIRDYGKIDVEKDAMFLYESIAKKRIPFFHDIFIHKGGGHNPKFYIEPFQIEFFCIQSYKIGEIKTESDFKQSIMRIMQIGRKLYAENENAAEAEKRTSLAKEIGALIKMYFLFS